MGSYPDLYEAVQASYVRPMRTTRILQPVVVLTMVMLLGTSTVVGVVIAGVVFTSPVPASGSVNAAQAFSLMASSLSFIYLVLHACAAKYNEPVGMVRPPNDRIHAFCFIAARLGLLMWMISLITASVIASRPEICVMGTRACTLQVVDLVNSNFGFLATGVLLTALEAVQYPFQLPSVSHAKKMALRMSTRGDDLFHRSVSVRTTVFEHHKVEDDDRLVMVHPQSVNHKKIDEDDKLIMIHPRPVVHRKSIPSSTSVSGTTSLSSRQERRLTPLLPMHPPHRSPSAPRTRGWGQEWIHAEPSPPPLPTDIKTHNTNTKPNPNSNKTLPKADSAISLSRKTSSGYSYSASGKSSDVSTSSNGSGSGTWVSSSTLTETSTLSRRTSRPRTVTPSSSIRNLTQRSPLSSMRSVDYPDIIVKPDLQFYPSKIQPIPESGVSLNPNRPSSISQLLPVANLHSLQRRSSSSFRPIRPYSLPPPNLAYSYSNRNQRCQYKYKYNSRDFLLAPRKLEGESGLVRRKTRDCRVPGAFPLVGFEVRERQERERDVDEHFCMIGGEYVKMRGGNRPRNGSLDSWLRERGERWRGVGVEKVGQRKLGGVGRANTTATAGKREVEKSLMVRGDKGEIDEAKGDLFRKLSFGDMEMGLGISFVGNK